MEASWLAGESVEWNMRTREPNTENRISDYPINKLTHVQPETEEESFPLAQLKEGVLT